MNELTLDELKRIEFDILKHFDAFCKEHNIRYYLAYGTLLGAIRYKKFIPWDDDVDVKTTTTTIGYASVKKLVRSLDKSISNK